jgi:hypothetical protein
MGPLPPPPLPKTSSGHDLKSRDDEGREGGGRKRGQVPARVRPEGGPLAEQREGLPVYKYRQPLLEALSHPASIVEGETGSGKTTQVRDNRLYSPTAQALFADPPPPGGLHSPTAQALFADPPPPGGLCSPTAQALFADPPRQVNHWMIWSPFACRSSSARTWEESDLSIVATLRGRRGCFGNGFFALDVFGKEFVCPKPLSARKPLPKSPRRPRKVAAVDGSDSSYVCGCTSSAANL